MRYITRCLCVGALLGAVGCSDSKWAIFRNNRDETRGLGANPTTTQLVDYLNLNSQKLQSIECPYLDLDIRQGFNQFGMRGKMVCDKPRNFRLIAEVAQKTEADIGSNRDEFWYWIARNDPPYLIHCSYRDLEQGVRIPFPFQPEWVIEALGMADYGSAQQYRLNAVRDTLELVRQVNSQGQTVQKVIVFNRSQAKVQVRAHILRDMRGKEICSAQILDVENINGIVVPRKIVLDYPAEKLQLKLKLFDTTREVAVNRRYDANQAAALFTRPSLAGVRTFDLARDAYNPTNQVRPAGGIFR